MSNAARHARTVTMIFFFVKKTSSRALRIVVQSGATGSGLRVWEEAGFFVAISALVVETRMHDGGLRSFGSDVCERDTGITERENDVPQ